MFVSILTNSHCWISIITSELRIFIDEMLNNSHCSISIITSELRIFIDEMLRNSNYSNRILTSELRNVYSCISVNEFSFFDQHYQKLIKTFL